MDLQSSLKSYLLLFFLLSFLNVTTINSSNPLKEEAVLFGGKFRALYVFGDSLVDAGNNNHLPTTVKANFPPYGSNFEGGEATGRFTNGKTIADYTAIYYGLPLVPAYLGLRKKERNIILTGFNYASAGCGILSVTGKAMGKCLSLKDQVKLFEKSIKKNLNTSIRTPSGLREHLAESLFMTSIGVNDYAFYKDGVIDGKDFADKLLHRYLIQLEKLHKLGARKFFINNIKPLGCYPNRVLKSVPRGSCDAHLNRVIRFFNRKLKRSLSIMKIKLNNTTFVYSDYFNFMLGVRGPQISQGQTSLVNITAPCCPKDFNGDSKTSCKRDSMVCEIPDSSHIFFDTRNPTQMANFLYSMECFEERRICHVI